MVAIRKCTENFVATEVDDEILIVDLDGGELFSLTGTARTVWEAIDGKRSEPDIVGKMTEMHEGNLETISGDVARLLQEFEQAALVARDTHKPL